MRWLAVGLALACGCPTPARYTEVRPDLGCERATRVARSHPRSGRTSVYRAGVGHPQARASPTASHRMWAFCYSRAVVVHTFGHSTLALADFLALLAAHGV